MNVRDTRGGRVVREASEVREGGWGWMGDRDEKDCGDWSCCRVGLTTTETGTWTGEDKTETQEFDGENEEEGDRPAKSRGKAAALVDFRLE